jgi:hypothetical protein
MGLFEEKHKTLFDLVVCVGADEMAKYFVSLPVTFLTSD